MENYFKHQSIARPGWVFILVYFPEVWLSASGVSVALRMIANSSQFEVALNYIIEENTFLRNSSLGTMSRKIVTA